MTKKLILAVILIGLLILAAFAGYSQKGPLHMKYDSLLKAYDSLESLKDDYIDLSLRGLVADTTDYGHLIWHPYPVDSVFITSSEVPTGKILVESRKYHQLIYGLMFSPILILILCSIFYVQGRKKATREFEEEENEVDEVKHYRYKIEFLDYGGNRTYVVTNNYKYNKTTKTLTDIDDDITTVYQNIKLISILDDIQCSQTV